MGKYVAAFEILDIYLVLFSRISKNVTVSSSVVTFVGILTMFITSVFTLLIFGTIFFNQFW